jgi:hypothetical protein
VLVTNGGEGPPDLESSNSQSASPSALTLDRPPWPRPFRPVGDRYSFRVNCGENAAGAGFTVAPTISPKFVCMS